MIRTSPGKGFGEAFPRERRDEAELQETSAEPPRRRCAPTWTRLIAKVFQVDPLVCRRCGGPLKVVVVRVPVDEEGRAIEGQTA